MSTNPRHQDGRRWPGANRPAATTILRYDRDYGQLPWWRHQMETFSALLAICAGNSPVPGEFPAQRPVTRSFDVLFDPGLNKQLSKQLWGWWFETLICSLWRHCNTDKIKWTLFFVKKKEKKSWETAIIRQDRVTWLLSCNINSCPSRYMSPLGFIWQWHWLSSPGLMPVTITTNDNEAAAQLLCPHMCIVHFSMRPVFTRWGRKQIADGIFKFISLWI